MSLLNLNSPAGQSPRGKKSLKMWMGAGLVVAVLGFGSTFAADITLNQPGGTTEFGQGVTETVYCGGDQTVTVTPISAYQNTVKSDDIPAQDSIRANVKVLSTDSDDTDGEVTVSNPNTYRVTIKSRSDAGIPRWGLDVSTSQTTGFWITNPTISSNVVVLPTNTQLANNYPIANYFFARESSTGKYKKVKSSTSDVDTRQVILQNATSLIPGAITTAADFKVGGVLISKIPDECIGVNFVISSYAETGSAQTLISSGADVVKEVAARWNGTSDVITASKDRTFPVPTSLVTATQNSKSLKFMFTTASGTALSADSLYKLIVETQEDALTVSP